MDRLWRNVGRTMHEYSILDRLWAAGRIEVSGIEHLHRARDQGKPILVAPVHLGNWEIVLVTGIACGHCGSGIYEPPQNRFEHRIANRVRARYGARFVAAGPHSAREAVRELQLPPRAVHRLCRRVHPRPRAGAVIRPAAADRRQYRLCGPACRPDRRRRHSRLLPADRRQRPVQGAVPAAAARSPERGDRNADVAENMKRLDAVIAPVIQAHLDQWYFALDFEFD